jgi:competence protein ComEA
MKKLLALLLNYKIKLQTYFDFSVREVNGFLVLLLLMSIYVLFTLFFEHLIPQKPISNLEKKQFDSLVLELDKNIKVKKQNDYASKIDKNIPPKPSLNINYFDFDPNTLGVDSLILLGIESKIAERIEKYRSKGGKFKQKEDVLKIYGFNNDLYHLLSPYIQMKSIDFKEKNTFKKPEFRTDKIVTLDLNTADSFALEKVYGIGFKLAARIVKYRNKLGGFVDVNQLNEVYGLNSDAILEINKKFRIGDNFVPQKIKLNQADFNTLKNHPYIGYKFAKVIFAYKNQHGNFTDFNQLTEIKIISVQDIEKMKSYLELD